MSTGTQVEVVMPQMGVSVSEGTITRWLKQPGDSIALDEPLLEISTDKVDTEVPSPGEGVVAEIRVQEGETVEVGTVLAVIGPRERRPPSPKARRSRRRPRRARCAAGPEPPRGTEPVTQAPSPPPAPVRRRRRSRRRSLSPRRRARRASASSARRRAPATGGPSSRRSSRGSRRSTASTPARSPAPARAVA